MTSTERAHVRQQHIIEWQASGVSGSVYCKQQSLVYHQFVYWRRKLVPIEDCLKQEQSATGLTRWPDRVTVWWCLDHRFTRRQHRVARRCFETAVMRHRYLRPSLSLPEIYLSRAPVDLRKQTQGLAVMRSAPSPI